MNVLLGPVCLLIEKVLGKLPFLVKGMTITERTKFMASSVLQEGDVWAETDFGAFDSTVSLEMREIEWEMVKDYMTFEEQLGYIILISCTVLQHVLLDKHADEFGSLETLPMRWSGEPLTSIGNALLNDFTGWSMPGQPGPTEAQIKSWLAMAACISVTQANAIKSVNVKPVKGLREGDDGFVAARKPVDLSGWGLQLGFNLEVEWHDDPRAVKFCGRYLSGDYNCDLVSVCDIRRTLDKLHLSTGSSHVDPKALLRSKLQAAWSLDSHTPLVATIVWALWPSVADAKVITTNQDLRKLKLAGTVSEPGFYPPVIRDSEYACLVYQNIDPDAARRHDKAIVMAALKGLPLPRFDFGLSTAKVQLFAASGI